MHAGDLDAWTAMRTSLWPEESRDGHADGIRRLLASDDAWGFVAQLPDGSAIGFAEIAIRKYANGCDTQPVAFLEGIWVDPGHRRCGAGGQLIAHTSAFVAARGFRELGSDTELHNRDSQAAHRAWGFSETERVVYFRKILGAAARE
jgi:aminoglycoside 6'-N-acetyltransferase I